MIRNSSLSLCQPAIFSLGVKLKFRTAHNRTFPAALVKKRQIRKLN